jgi:hypothetical protein
MASIKPEDVERMAKNAGYAMSADELTQIMAALAAAQKIRFYSPKIL